MDPEPRTDPFDGEYGAVTAPGGFHVLSLLCFLAALGARFLSPLLPQLVHPSLLSAILVPAFAGLGVLLGLVALRKPETRGMAKLALGLNAVVLLLSGLLFWALSRILPD